MLAPSASASGQPVAKRGGGSSLAIGVSLVFLAGDAQATTHTRSVSAHTRGRARSVTAVRFSLTTGSPDTTTPLTLDARSFRRLLSRMPNARGERPRRAHARV